MLLAPIEQYLPFFNLLIGTKRPVANCRYRTKFSLISDEVRTLWVDTSASFSSLFHASSKAK